MASAIPTPASRSRISETPASAGLHTSPTYLCTAHPQPRPGRSLYASRAAASGSEYNVLVAVHWPTRRVGPRGSRRPWMSMSEIDVTFGRVARRRGLSTILSAGRVLVARRRRPQARPGKRLLELQVHREGPCAARSRAEARRSDEQLPRSSSECTYAGAESLGPRPDPSARTTGRASPPPLR